jgi:CheY-like chemotaxis protein/class 3 adenylate cyclase
MTERSEPQVEGSARILIVDDEPFNVDYLEQELESLGFVTETATNGVEALERVAAAPPDLVLLDVMMPELDGITALRLLKDDPETRLIPVVLMTALNAVEDRVRGIEAGADDFLSKPVDDRELLARIRTSLSVKRAIDETVGELRSTSAHLERFGRREREVAVLAVEWRAREGNLPDEAAGFLGRGHRAETERRILALGGMPSEGEGSLLVAVFDGPDLAGRSIAAVNAALAVLNEGGGAELPEQLTLSAAVVAGQAQVGSIRVTAEGDSRWVYGAEGEPVDRASGLARGAPTAGVVVEGEPVPLLSDRFDLEPVGDGTYLVLARTDQEETGPSQPETERSIKTILVTDIVDSTGMAERLGDRAWAELLFAHEDAIRAELVVHRGEEVDTTGDGFLASFASPGRAIRCALAIRDRVAALGVTIRAGLHTGEVERVDGKLRGIALHVASRISAHAGDGEVLVSTTTRELAAGSRLRFADRGEHSLKGVSGVRRLFAVDEQSSDQAL